MYRDNYDRMLEAGVVVMFVTAIGLLAYLVFVS